MTLIISARCISNGPIERHVRIGRVIDLQNMQLLIKWRAFLEDYEIGIEPPALNRLHVGQYALMQCRSAAASQKPFSTSTYARVVGEGFGCVLPVHECPVLNEIAICGLICACCLNSASHGADDGFELNCLLLKGLRM